MKASQRGDWKSCRSSTTFSIPCPIRIVKAEISDGEIRERMVRSTATRVLIIDDDPLIRTLLVSALRKECLVAVASEGSEGFRKAIDLTPDVAVIDINMP